MTGRKMTVGRGKMQGAAESLRPSKWALKASSTIRPIQINRKSRGRVGMEIRNPNPGRRLPDADLKGCDGKVKGGTTEQKPSRGYSKTRGSLINIQSHLKREPGKRRDRS